MNDENLIPCPFCGSLDLYISESDNGLPRWVSCNNCECDGPLLDNCLGMSNEVARLQVIAAWNRREYPAKEGLVEQIEPADKEKGANSQYAARMVLLVDEWQDNANSGYDVLASHALDKLKELIDEVYP